MEDKSLKTNAPNCLNNPEHINQYVEKLFKKYDLSKFYAKETESLLTHTQKVIEAAERLIELGYVDESMINDLIYTCFCHDLGKMNGEFQKRIKLKIFKNIKVRFDEDKEIPHNTLSVFFIDKEKCDDYSSVCFSVLYHHYRDEGKYAAFIRSHYDRLQDSLNGFDCYLPPKIKIMKFANDIGHFFAESLVSEQKQRAVLLKGFLHKCDYTASGGIECELPNEFLLDKINYWQKQNNIELNNLQKFCFENTDQNIVVTAPTGMGKTEAGLLWCGNNKCFFVLPLKTAINAMFKRLVKLTNEKSGDEYKNRVALIHSDVKEVYLKNDLEQNQDFDFDYLYMTRQFSLPITVCTPDQIFDFALKYPCYEYKLAIASYSKFIIDEIQVYSPELLATIMYAIKMIHIMGGKIAVLTATLPPFVRCELTKILGDGFKSADFSGDGILKHNVSVTEACMTADDIWNTVQKIRCDKAKKFLVVCNSIDIATKIFDKLSDYCADEDIEINLFHSGFIKKDRADKEERILAATKEENKDKTEIWVSTSVVEASLDIDFDILFTELSDLFSLFQRFGRVNRKGYKDYFKTDCNCYVFTEQQGNAKRYRFTDETIYELSKKGIMSVSGIINEKQKSELIEKYLSVENLNGSEYEKDYKNAFSRLEESPNYLNDKDNFRLINRVDVIPIEVYEDETNRAVIEESLRIINDFESSKEDKIIANSRITDFTVSVSKYYADKGNRQLIKYKMRKDGIQILENCKYDNERGIQMIKEYKDGGFDNFI